MVGGGCLYSYFVLNFFWQNNQCHIAKEWIFSSFADLTSLWFCHIQNNSVHREEMHLIPQLRGIYGKCAFLIVLKKYLPVVSKKKAKQSYH